MHSASHPFETAVAPARDARFDGGLYRSTDPLGFRGGTTNLSEYVGNDPLNKIDPTGLAEEGFVFGMAFEPRSPDETDVHSYQRDYGRVGLPLYYVYDKEIPDKRMFIGNYYPEAGFVEYGYRPGALHLGSRHNKNRVTIEAVTSHVTSWGTSDDENEWRLWFERNHMETLNRPNSLLRAGVIEGLRSPSFYNQLQSTAAVIEFLANVDLAVYELVAGIASPAGTFKLIKNGTKVAFSDDVIRTARSIPDEPAKFGAGGFWPTIGEVAHPSVVRQLSPNACGPASGVMLLKSKGVNVFQSNIAGLKREVRTDVMTLAIAMNKLMPAGTTGQWIGASVARTSSNLRALASTGPHAMVLKSPNSGLHMVVVDGLEESGRVIVRDPYKGTRYLMESADFLDAMQGPALYWKAK